MFSRFSLSQYIMGVLAIVILSLGVWSWRQSSEIDSLQATNHAQAQTILQLEQSQAQLKRQLEAEQAAVAKQERVANQLRTQVGQHREKVRVILQKEPCGVTAMPSDVIDSIKRVQQPKAN